jgi:predicted LPLAT superfamily acyltransferase
MRLATITGAPVVMVFGLFRGGRRYEIVFEALGTHALQCYVERLEHQARHSPYNWFNFFDYWGA